MYIFKKESMITHILSHITSTQIPNMFYFTVTKLNNLKNN